MQILQIDKRGTALFDGTTLVDPDLNPSITVENIGEENRTVVTIPDGVAAGRFDVADLLGIPEDNTFVLHELSIGGDFAGDFTGGLIQILGPPNPLNTGRSVKPITLSGTSGITIFGGSQWNPPGSLLAIRTDAPDIGPYRVVVMVEKVPNQKLMAAIASGELS